MVAIVGIVDGSIGACAVASWSSLGQIADNTFPDTRFNVLKSGTSINLPAEEQFESFCVEQSQLHGKTSIRVFLANVQIGKIGIIANFVSRYICSFLLCLQHMMLVNVKLDINGCNRITFQDCRCHWFSYFLLAKLK